jgi:hypothetical protein
MNLIYSTKRHPSFETIHRFTILGDFNSSDRDVLKKSFMNYFSRLQAKDLLQSLVIVDFSECSLKINENKLQECILDIKNQAVSVGLTIVIAQSDIESIHAENLVIEKALQSRIQLLENKLELIDSVKNKIRFFQEENANLKEIISAPSRKSREQKAGKIGIFEKLWSDQ